MTHLSLRDQDLAEEYNKLSLQTDTTINECYPPFQKILK